MTVENVLSWSLRTTFSSEPTDDIHIFSPEDQMIDHITCFRAAESLIMDHITCWCMPKEEWAPGGA